MLLEENKMRPIAALVLGVLGCGAAASFLMTPGRALAQPNVRSAQSMQSTDSDLQKLLVAFADAWNRHDVDLLMSMMTDDGVFEASGGNHVNGERHEGRQAVRAAYAAVFAQYPDAHWGKCPALRKGRPGSVRVDIHRYTEGWQAGRGHWLRLVHVSRWQDRCEELVQKESPADNVKSQAAV
jgi:uncharacterized protein (TIGR02246 family)